MDVRLYFKERKIINLFVIVRIGLGLLFVLSGIEKLISPYQNFLYVIQSYEFIGPPFDKIAAFFMPWVELIVGVFLVLGLWLRISLIGIASLFSIFIVVVAQALIRHLPVTECGCFGQLVSFSLPTVLTMDSLMLIVTLWLIVRIKKTSELSLDKRFL